MSKRDDRIKQGVFKLLFSFRFFGTLACSLDRVEVPETSRIKTMATDGRKMYYCPEFVDKMKELHLNFVVCHEVLHAALGHCNPYRIGNRTVMVYDQNGNEISLWNIAADYVVNYLIVQALKETGGKWAEMPNEALYEDKYGGKSVEQVYSELLKDSKSWPKHQGPGKGNGQPMIPGGKTLADDHLSQEELKNLVDDVAARQIDHRWKNIIEKEIVNAKRKGSLPGVMRLIEELVMTPPKVDWREELGDFIVDQYKSTYRLNPPNKKYLHMRMIMPTVHGEHIDLFVASDTSGSMIPALPVIYAELQHTFSQFDSYRVTLFECDAAIASEKVYENGEDFTTDCPKGMGGGGTSFVPVFNRIEEIGENPYGKVLVYSTDGYGDFPREAPPYEVIWLVPEDGLPTERFPFGRVIRIDLDNI